MKEQEKGTEQMNLFHLPGNYCAVKHEIASHKGRENISNILKRLKDKLSASSAEPLQNGAAPVLRDNVFPATPFPLLLVALLKHVNPYGSPHPLS